MPIKMDKIFKNTNKYGFIFQPDTIQQCRYTEHLSYRIILWGYYLLQMIKFPQVSAILTDDSESIKKITLIQKCIIFF